MASWIVSLLLFAQSDPVAEAVRALEAKQYPAAITHLKGAAAKSPQDHQILFNLALAYSLNGQEELAVAEYLKVLELQPELYAAQLNLGILLHANKPNAALPYLEASRKAKPSEFSPAFYLAESLARLGRSAEAEPHYAAALLADPKSPHAAIGLARSTLAAGRLEEAAINYEKAAAAHPQLASSVLELADRYLEKGEKDRALAIYSKFPEDLAARQKSGEVLLSMNRAGEAIPHLEYVALKAKTPASQLRLGEAYLKDKQPEKGLEALRQAVQTAPTEFDLRMFYALSLRENKNFEAAVRELTEAIKIKPNAQDAWSELATMQAVLERPEQALLSLERVRQLGAEKEGHLFLRAITLDKLMQYEPALANYRQFLEKAGGRYPDQEFQARQRSRIIQRILEKKR